MMKSSLDYTELAGLREAINQPSIPKDVKQWIEKRIKELESK